MADAHAPSPLDTRVANPARVYDALLGGKDNYAVDRAVAARMLDVEPMAAVAARDNRYFLLRAVRYLAAQEGVRQFIDVGAGLPALDNVHKIAHAVDPACRVVYVDHDPVVVAHADALLCTQRETTGIVHGDMYDPLSILHNRETRRLIDFTRPVGLLLAAVLHFVRDSADPWGLVQEFMYELAPSSFVVISHGTADTNQSAAQVTEVYETNAPLVTRTYAQTLRFFDGLQMVSPGLTWTHEWRPEVIFNDMTYDDDRRRRRLLYGGVGRTTRHVQTSPAARTRARPNANILGACPAEPMPQLQIKEGVAKDMSADQVQLDCKIKCLRLPPSIFVPLGLARGTTFDPPKTVGDVLNLARKRALGEITGLGSVRIREIEESLIRAGFHIEDPHNARSDTQHTEQG